MPLYKNVFYWFIALLVILVIGFWKTYFSLLGQDTDQIHITHHLHAVAMIGWVLLLIAQSWLIRNRRNPQHRMIGKLSFVVAPLVFLTGLIVVFTAQARASEPTAPFMLGIFWFGLFSAMLFAILYSLAIIHRRNMQLHARYMVGTALVFVVPGLSRAVLNYLGPTGIWIPTFFQMMWVPLLVAAWLLFRDWRSGAPTRPYLLFSILWLINLALWVLLPTWGWWADFTLWSVAVLA